MAEDGRARIPATPGREDGLGFGLRRRAAVATLFEARRGLGARRRAALPRARALQRRAARAVPREPLAGARRRHVRRETHALRVRAEASARRRARHATRPLRSPRTTRRA